MTACRLVMFLALVVSLPAHAATTCDALTATGAWVREPPPVANVAAGYVSLTNTGNGPLTVARIESDCCGSVMMHDTVSDGDRVRMMHLDSLHLGAGETVDFVPGGKHLMLMAPRKPLRAGESLGLDFICDDGGTRRIAFDIMKAR